MSKLELKRAKLDVSEVKDFMRHIIKTNRLLQESGKTPVTVEICGPAGLGKTSIAKQLGEEFNLDVVKLNLTQLSEIGDLVGFPLRQFEMIKDKELKKVKDAQGIERTGYMPLAEPIIKWVDEVALDQFKHDGFTLTGNNRTVDCPPEWIVGKKRGILLILDDYTRADLRFTQATMELISCQEYVSWKLPPDSHIILTTNPSDGDYLVNELDTAQKTRFLGIDLKFSAERWAEWAEREGIDTRAINFILQHAEVVNDKVNPRSLTMFFNSISSIADFEEPSSLGLIQMIGEGSIGPDASLMFTQWINNRMDKLISPKEILEGANEKEVILRLKGAIKPKGENYRADIASILGLRVLNYALMKAEKDQVTESMIERLILLVTDEEIFSNDISYTIAKKLIAGNKKAFEKMLMNRAVQTMIVK